VSGDVDLGLEGPQNLTASAGPGRTETQERLTNVARGSAPALEQLAAMNLDTLENSGLDEPTYHLVRLAALVASDAAPVSYLVNLGPAADAGVTLEQAQGSWWRSR
jgi:4-carboxymuconolactone decarboxylase